MLLRILLVKEVDVYAPHQIAMGATPVRLLLLVLLIMMHLLLLSNGTASSFIMMDLRMTRTKVTVVMPESREAGVRPFRPLSAAAAQLVAAV